jgi:hypothetical protein
MTVRFDWMFAVDLCVDDELDEKHVENTSTDRQALDSLYGILANPTPNSSHGVRTLQSFSTSLALLSFDRCTQDAIKWLRVVLDEVVSKVKNKTALQTLGKVKATVHRLDKTPSQRLQGEHLRVMEENKRNRIRDIMV